MSGPSSISFVLAKRAFCFPSQPRRNVADTVMVNTLSHYMNGAREKFVATPEGNTRVWPKPDQYQKMTIEIGILQLWRVTDTLL